jgi:hypothetical protein
MGLPCTILFTSGSLRLRIICSATEHVSRQVLRIRTATLCLSGKYG